MYEVKGNTEVVGYCDADWARIPTIRQSTIGYCAFIGRDISYNMFVLKGLVRKQVMEDGITLVPCREERD